MANWKKVIVSGSAADLASLSLDTALPVGSGGTGASSLTDGGILLGSGTGAITATSVLTNGQLLIGDGTGDPTVSTITAGSGISVTNGAGSITIAADGLGAGTVTSVATSGTVNGLTLTGGTITTSGTVTLGGTLANVANSALTNDSVTIGSTEVALGATVTTFAGLTSVTSTDFVGALTGNADTSTKIASITNSNIVQLTETQTLTNKDLTAGTNTFPTFNQDTTGNAATATEAAGVAANSVALGTDTTGNYVGTLTAGTGITSTGATSGEGVAHSLSVDYGSSAGDAVEGNTTITVNVASGELTRDVGSAAQTLGGAPSYTLGLADTITGDRTFSDNINISGDLIVNGTASFQNTTNLEVTDRFVLFASGSTGTGDGGIVVQQATQDVGELFGYDSGETRWGLKTAFSADSAAFTPDAFMSAVTTLSSTNPNTSGPAARYNKSGNIYVSSGDESIWIYA